MRRMPAGLCAQIQEAGECMNLTFPLLGPDDIEVKIKKVSGKGAIGVLYKTSRTDMRILDEVVGPFGWKDAYDEIKGNLYCTIFIRDDTGEWIGKTDCGTESREDGEGNEKKGEASDAFKRAGFKWGIGRELYSSPFIFLRIETEQDNGRWKVTDPYFKPVVKEIEYDDLRRINFLSITDTKGTVVYTYDNRPRELSSEEKRVMGEILQMYPNKEKLDKSCKRLFGEPLEGLSVPQMHTVIKYLNGDITA